MEMERMFEFIGRINNTSKLERNIKYIINIVSSYPGEYGRFELSDKLKRVYGRKEILITIKEADEALEAAESRGLIVKKEEAKSSQELPLGRYYLPEQLKEK